jgi:hypothetical protein
MVRKSAIAYRSPEDVPFDPISGRITFPNFGNAKIIPFISSITEGSYTTETTYIREVGKNYFVVRGNLLDTSGRNFPAHDFTAAVLTLGR